MRFRSVALLAVCALSCRNAPEPPSADARVLAIADAIVAEGFEQFPGRAARLRPPGVRHDGLPDDSLAGVAARQQRHDGWLRDLHQLFNSGQVTADARLAYDLARDSLERAAALRPCHLERWRVSQMPNGWQVQLADTAQAQPVGTPELREQALTRFARLPRDVDDQIQALRVGLAEGYSAPRRVVDLVVGQLDALIAAPTEDSPFASPALRDGDPAFRERFLAQERDAVRPALRRYRDFLANEYAPRARGAVGVAANPNGSACYRGTLHYATTLEIPPENVHERGLAALERIELEMRAISARSFGGAPVPALLERLRSDPASLYRDREHVLAPADASLLRAWAALPQAFGRIPRAPAILEPIPDYQARTAAAHYLQAALDGSSPAAYRVRLVDPAKQSWTIGESTAFHEVVPGHHLQVALANESEALPAIARFGFTSGFGEGWALYAEQLADELGLYSSDADRLGMLSNRAWRAVRMVVDTGLHAFGWERQRAIDFLLAHTALSPDQAAQEVDRYIAWPGQAPSYLLGYEEILALRAEAERRLGPRFDLRAFHDAVLGGGGVSLPVLRARVAAWMETR